MLVGFMLPMLSAHAEEFAIREAQATFDQNALSVEAKFDLNLSDAVDEALHNGVSIQLITTLDLFTQRPFVWDKHIAQWAFSHDIRYHALTDRYVLTSPQHPEIRSFSSLSDLFSEIETFNFQSDIMGETLPDSKHGYKLQLRIALDKTTLPAPLRVMTFVSTDWRLKSDIHEWSIPGTP